MKTADAESVRTELLARVRDRQASVGVVGLGYVGLPLAIAFAQAGYPVTGLEVDERRVAALGRAESYIRHISPEPLVPLVQKGRLKATTDFQATAQLDCVIFCVPTPLSAAREPDMSFIVRAAESVAPHVRPGQLFVLESTTYPGTTEEVLLPILQRGGLKVGQEIFLAFSPEREDPGNARFNTRTIPKLVGGASPACLEIAQALYASALEKVVAVSSTRVAEMAKLLENIFRSVNIALVNELKMLCDRMELDVWEVIQAASTKPFGFMPFYPGPGLGGHCIPIDPFYLTWKAREYEFQTKFIELAGEVNTSMPYYVVQRTMDALNQHKKSLNGSRILVLGAAYKKDVDDMRESPSLRLITLLEQKGAQVAYHDPYVPRIAPVHGFPREMASVALTDQALAQADAVLIATDHSAVDYARVVEQARLVIDTRNATKAVTRGRDKIVKA